MTTEGGGGAKPATLKDIAERAGVSIDTVSRILNNKSKLLWPKTARRAAQIREIAAELGYRPNASARAMRTGRSGIVTLLRDGSFFPWELADGIHDALAERGLHLSLAAWPDDAATRDGELPIQAQQWQSEGLLVNCHYEAPQRLSAFVEQTRIPCVFINNKRPFNCAHPDEFDAGYQACMHLLKLGHARIAYVDCSYDRQSAALHFSVHDRYAGYCKAMSEAGLQPRLIGGERAVPYVERCSTCVSWLRQTPLPTAMLAEGDITAYPLLYAAAEVGVRIPSDLSLVTIAGKVGQAAGLPITTMVSPWNKVGAEAVAMIELRLSSASETPTRVLKFDLREGCTCAAHKQNKL